MSVTLSTQENRLSHIEDFDYTLKDQPFQAKKLVSGPLYGRRLSFEIGGFAIDSMETSCPTLLTGTVPSNTINLVISACESDSPEQATKRNINAFCFAPGSQAFRILTPRNSSLSVCIDLDEMKKSAQPPTYDKLIELPSSIPQHQDLSGEDTHTLDNFLFIHELFEELSALNKKYISSSELFTIENELLDCVIDYFASSITYRKSLSDRRIAIFFRALMIANNESEKGLTVAELANKVHVSIRALQYIFFDFLDTSPNACISSLRMNSIRRELLNSKYKSGLIRNLARSYGIVNAGNLSTSYKRLFGEPPLKTLKKRSLK